MYALKTREMVITIDFKELYSVVGSKVSNYMMKIHFEYFNMKA